MTRKHKQLYSKNQDAIRRAPNAKEKTLLASAKKKIAAINRNMRTAKGLTKAETKVAAKAGLIDEEQRWWWTEAWQKGERRAQRDIDEGRVSKAYDNVDEALRELKARYEAANEQARRIIYPAGLAL